MKKAILTSLRALGVGLALTAAGQVEAGHFQVLHTFSTAGQSPIGGLTAVGDVLYGATSANLSISDPPPFGFVYSLNKDGSNHQVLHEFSGPEGANPESRLALVGSRLVGTTSGRRTGQPETGNWGTIFAIDPDGGNFEVLHTFDATGAASGFPYTSVMVSGDRLYGTDRSKIYSLNPDGSDLQITHSFSPDRPSSGLIQIGSRFFGTTFEFNPLDPTRATLYSINTDGTDIQILHEFQMPDAPTFQPISELALVGSRFYGTTAYGGEFGMGTIWSINSDGTDFQTLHEFGAELAAGFQPQAGLTLLDGKLYGVADSVLFSINLDGSSFTVLQDLPAMAFSEMIAIESTLYGTVVTNGPGNAGYVFAYTVPEPATWILATPGLSAVLVASRHRRSNGNTA